jgi:hypothetical protein
MASNDKISSNERKKGGKDGREDAVGAQDSRSTTGAKEPLFTRLLRWLYPDKRKAQRCSYPPIVSYLGAVHTTRPYQIADISLKGFYMITLERWLPGTTMLVTLERTDLGGSGFGKSITLLSTVARTGLNGIGFSFCIADEGEVASGFSKLDSASSLPVSGASKDDLNLFLEGLNLSTFDASELERAS